MKRLEEFILRLLLEQPMTGYTIVKQIESRTGWKPSWGSIYPQLENLESQGIIKGNKEGRSTKYALTASGRKHAHQRVQKSAELLNEIIERLRVMQGLTGEDLGVPISYLSELAEGKNPFMPIEKESTLLKKMMLGLWQDGKIKPHAKEINTILRDARKKLEGLK